MPKSYIKLGHDRFRPYSLQFIIHFKRYVAWANDKVV